MPHFAFGVEREEFRIHRDLIIRPMGKRMPFHLNLIAHVRRSASKARNRTRERPHAYSKNRTQSCRGIVLRSWSAA